METVNLVAAHFAFYGVPMGEVDAMIREWDEQIRLAMMQRPAPARILPRLELGLFVAPIESKALRPGDRTAAGNSNPHQLSEKKREELPLLIDHFHSPTLRSCAPEDALRGYLLHRRWVWPLGSRAVHQSVEDAVIRSRHYMGLYPVLCGSKRLFFCELELWLTPRIRQPCLVQVMVSRSPAGHLITELFMEVGSTSWPACLF